MKQWPYYTNGYYKYTHGSFNIDNKNYYLKKLHNIYFCKNKNHKAQKPKLIPKIKCTILLEQLYYIYYNIKPENAQKGVIAMCSPTWMFDKVNSMKAAVECGENLA